MSSSVRPPSLLALPSYLASQSARYGIRHLETVLEQHDLLLGHHAILAALNDFGALSQRELTERLGVDKSHLVGRIDRLEAIGLIARTVDPADRRRHQVNLTGSGRRLVEQLQIAAHESQQHFLRVLTADERTTLEALLRRVLDANDEAAQMARVIKAG
jgi:DNA-binding MarR family transcriptional regulator